MLSALPEREGKGELLGEVALRWSIPITVLSRRLASIWCPIISWLQERARWNQVSKVSQRPIGASTRNHNHYLLEHVGTLESVSFLACFSTLFV